MANAGVARIGDAAPSPLDWAVVDGLVAALDLLPVGALLVDPDEARILMRNRRAAHRLAAGHGVRECQGRLRCDFVEDSAALLRALAGLKGTGRRPPVALSVRQAGGGRSLELMLTSTPGGDSVAVLVSSREESTGFNAALAKKLYGLSEREVDVAREVAAGRTLADIAATLEVEKETVRSHLKQIFSKTQTARQADLVRLLSTGLFAVGAEP
ncbi:MAG TPA: helix-turn-helix transcriptional regulator [Polyangiaceae bacterium]|nr:helix-turn-helix transcriptional regulator [Polyangiaceae bacterium]